jgi:type 1 glutamine amidotransferase
MPAASLRYRRCALLMALAAVAALSLPLRGADVRIVLIAGRPSHPPGMHEFRAGSMLLAQVLESVPGVTADVYTGGWPTRTADGREVDDNAALDGADAVLIYSDGGRGNPAIQDGRIEVIDALAARGAGLAFAHYAVEVPTGPAGDAMHRWTGGFYETNFSVNPMWTPSFTEFPDHPVTRGVGPFETHDEWYFNMRWAPAAQSNITPILVATPSDDVRDGPYVNPSGPYPHIVAASGRAETMMWVYERPDGGRSFGFTGGHTHTNWGDPDQRRIVANALLWIAHVDVPEGGVRDSITEADLSTNLDEKPQR